MTDNLSRQTIKRRIIIAITIAIYLAIWTFLFYSAHTVAEEDSNASFMLGLIVISGIIFLPYFITYVILIEANDGIKRKDYLIGLIIVLLPVIVAVIDIKSGNLK